MNRAERRHPTPRRIVWLKAHEMAQLYWKLFERAGIQKDVADEALTGGKQRAYERAYAGTVHNFFSALPDVEETLLARSVQ